MILTIPIYLETLRPKGSPVVYQARPLFFDGPRLRGEYLERLMARLSQDLGQQLATLGRNARHNDLAAWTFYPRLTQQRLELTLTLRRRTARCRYLFVLFRQFGRRIVFTPSVPDVWFDLARGEPLRDRAAEVLTRHFRDRERDDEDVNPEAHALSGTASVTPLEVVLHPPSLPPAPKQVSFLALDEAPPMTGAAELRRVGRCLDRQYPDDLDRVVLRDTELAELTRLLDAPEQRPVLLVGPRQAGKTALVHEYVYRRVSARDSAYRDRGNVWLLAPQRLISGMSYVGQWENRLLAILREARRREHILYVDDLLGLFQAGRTSGSSLSVAAVLKPYLERRRVRLLGEITPEALRVLREQDRGFADLFHLLPVAEPSEAQTLRILIDVYRQLETRHRCRFALDVLPTVIDLQRRYDRGSAFPGKAAAFLRQLAVKHRGQEVKRPDALGEFHVRSGLAVTFLDRQARLARQDVLDGLGKHVIGQERALNAAADVIAIAKARLNDPDRPLAAFLFLGPTGVGKTQCARALAAYLFGDPDRLVRFDLNEYAEAGSSMRLVGTFSQPEGLLTSAVRRQPFAVVLLDEVEKAHPEVFDLLLQVLGEGRLTDALGRTADFTNTILVLTSNLGVREAEGQLGFRQDEAANDAVFVRAAERFFRPEFFNRLDRVLPFRRLTRDHVRDIARKLLDEVFGREGLVQRKCVLSVANQALERIVDAGYDPVLGARALKRSVERHLTEPVAAQLAGLRPGDFTAVRVYPGPDQLAVRVQALEQVAPLVRPAINLDDPVGLLRRVRAAVRRIEDDFAALRPAGPITLGQVRPEQYRYFALREQAEQVRDAARRLGDEAEGTLHGQRGLPTYSKPDAVRGRIYKIIRQRYTGGVGTSLLREMAAALDINEYLHDLVESAEAVGSGPQADELLRLLHQTALLHTLAEAMRHPTAERVLLWPHGLDGGATPDAVGMIDNYKRRLPSLHLDVTELPPRDEPPTSEPPLEDRYLLVQGPHAPAVTALEVGTHLFCPAHAGIQPVQVDVVPLPDGDDPAVVVGDRRARRRQWLDDLARGRAAVEDDPLPLGPVVRVYGAGRGAIDLRTGLTGGAGAVPACLLAALPLPPEVTA